METTEHNQVVWRSLGITLLAIAALLTGAGTAQAAALSYPNSARIYLSTPNIALTIAAGSVADGLTVNATSVAVTLSSTTGGTFTLTSPQALTSSTNGGGGTLSQTCSSGIETDTITQVSGSETYTLTPSGSACTQPTSGGGGDTSSGGGGISVGVGGGGSAYDLSINGGATTTPTTSVTLSLYGSAAYTMEVSQTSTFAGTAWIPYATTMPWTLSSIPGVQTVYVQFKAVGGTIAGNAEESINYVPAGTPASASTTIPAITPSTVSSTASLAAELAGLQAELATLENQAGESQPAAAPAQFTFTRNLSLGMTGSDVKELQLFLILEDSGPAARKLAAHGTTLYFGSLTRSALIEFQQLVGIKPASGYFGPITRAYVNKLMQ